MSQSKFIIWLDDLDVYVQEGSGIPSLFATKREATKRAKELWPKSNWTIRSKAYIKTGEKRREAADIEWRKQMETTLIAGTILLNRFTNYTKTKPYLVFKYEGRNSQPPVFRASTLKQACTHAEKLAKTFVSVKYPNREVWVADFSLSEDQPTPYWVVDYRLDEDLKDVVSAKKILVSRDNSKKGLEQLTPLLTTEGKWVCPVTNKVYDRLSKYIFNAILKEVRQHPDMYLALPLWKAFNFGAGWICPFTGKTFKKAGKRLNDHIAKQKDLIRKGLLP